MREGDQNGIEREVKTYRNMHTMLKAIDVWLYRRAVVGDVKIIAIRHELVLEDGPMSTPNLRLS